MDDVPHIIDIERVIEPYLEGAKLIHYTGRYLTKPGDNYGSVLLAIDAEITTAIGTKVKLPLVAKLPPITIELFWNMFQPERTCLTENAIYKSLCPAIQKLQLKEGISQENIFDGFAKYYGSRISLDPSSKVLDKNALLVLENLQLRGFRAGNRHKMFDLTHSQLILKHMAQFHALPIALRQKSPTQFEANIRPYFLSFNANNGITDEARIQFEEELYGDVKLATGGDLNVLQRIKELVEISNKNTTEPEKTDDAFSTIVHYDMWVNNLMIKYDDNGLPDQVKFIDFQMAQYDSLAKDIIFFMFSSVEIFVLEKHFDELLELYYKSFIQCLQSVGIPTEDYSYVAFIKEICTYGPCGITQALQMIRIILADASAIPENFKDLNLEAFSKMVGNKNIIQRTGDVIRLGIKYRLFYDV